MSKWEKRSKVGASIAVVLVIGALALSGAWQRRQAEEARQLAQAVQQATELLHAGLERRAVPPAELPPPRLRDASLARSAELYAEHARLVALQNAERLKRAEAADRSLQALTDHLGARGRSAGWIQEAVALKGEVERSYADYERSLKAVGAALEALPERRKALAGQVDEALLYDEAQRLAELVAVRTDALRAGDELKRIRSLPSR